MNYNIQKKTKIFSQIAFVFLISVLGALCSAKAADEVYTCLYQRPDLTPSADDPYKVRLTEVTPTLMDTISNPRPETFKNEKVAEFYKHSLMSKDEIKNIADPRRKVGPYRVGGFLGNGDEGYVYLAQHMPSQILCAVKTFSRDPGLSFEEAAKRIGEVGSYQDIERLFGLYRSKKWEHHDLASYYMFIPLVDGNLVNYFSYSKSFNFYNYELNGNQLVYHNLRQNLELLQATLREHQYLFDHRVAQVEVNSPNTMFSYDGKYLVFVDLGGTLASVKNEETYDVSLYSLFYLRALGIYDHLEKNSYDLKVKVPEAIKKFHEKIRPKSGDSLCFRAKHPLYFSSLKKYVEEFAQDVERELS